MHYQLFYSGEFEMTENDKIIDNCITDLIETVTKNIIERYNNGSVKQADEVDALASLIKARAMTKISNRE